MPYITSGVLPSAPLSMITFYGPWLSEEATLIREALSTQTQAAPGVDWICLCHPLKNEARWFFAVSCQPVPRTYASRAPGQLALQIATDC